MKAVCKRDILVIREGSEKSREDILIEENRLDILLNGERVTGLLCTPIDLEDLATGYLVSENIIKKIDDILSLNFDENRMSIDIEVKNFNSKSIERLNTEAVMISGCGKGHTANIDPEKIDAAVIRGRFTVLADTLCKRMEGFEKECRLYELTGAVHTAQLVFEDGSSLVAEDIAQHNTIDKVMGKALREKRDSTHAFLLLSGRLSSEMVAKSVMHGVPIVASRTAATCLGVDIAEKFGITLAGFVRGRKMNLYTHPHRVVAQEETKRP